LGASVYRELLNAWGACGLVDPPDVINVNIVGYSWSSEAYTDEYARRLYVNNGNAGVSVGLMYYGQQVRCVK
jgi:hypothetical protein